MRMFKLFLFALIVLMLSACSTKGVTDKVNLDIKRVHIKEASMAGLKAVVTVKVSNANWFGVTVSRLAYRVSVNGREVGGGKLENVVEIPSHGVTEAEVPLEVGSDALGGLVGEALKGKLKYTVKGEADMKTWLGTYTMPFDTEKKKKDKKPKPE
jgi:LEA14-like dessication related protein